MKKTLPLLLALILWATVYTVHGQPGEPLNLFVDCSSCNSAMMKQKINYVNYLVDPSDAALHIFVVSQSMNSGGRLYKINYIGQQAFEGDNLNIEYEAAPTLTYTERSEELIKRIELGLVGFLAGTNMVEYIQLEIDAPESVGVEEDLVHDPWNSWIFEVYNSVNWAKESSRKTLNLQAGMDIDKATPEIRIRINPSFSYREQIINTDENDIVSIQRRSALYGSVVKSLNDHWSAGMFSGYTSSSYSNIELAASLFPALEYSFFSYSEVPFKEFTINYRLGWVYHDYFEQTIYLEDSEQFFQQALNLDLRLRQPWGYVFTSLKGASHVRDFNKNRLTFDGRVSFRVIKGLSVRLDGRFEMINDQISLPLGETTLEEVLLGQKQLATNYKTSLSFGLSYTFGSIYNNVVNTRL